MKQHLSAISLLVRDYEEALAWYTRVLGFTLIEDTPLGADKRWVVIAPPGSSETRLVLARAVTPGEVAAIGRQGAGRVWLFLQTDDFERDHRALASRGVKFHEAPRHEPYGMVAVFEDLHGNCWDLLQPAAPRA